MGACTSVDEIGGEDCSSVDFLYLENRLPRKVVSGSDVLYGPVGVSSMTIPGGRPHVSLYEVEAFPHDMFQGVYRSLALYKCCVQIKFLLGATILVSSNKW